MPKKTPAYQVKLLVIMDNATQMYPELKKTPLFSIKQQNHIDKYNFDLDSPLEEISKQGGEKLPSHSTHAFLLNT